MLILHIKFTIIFILIAIGFKFVTKIITVKLILEEMSLSSALMSCGLLIQVSLFLGYISTKTRSIVAGSIFHVFIDWTQTVVNIVE